MTNLEPYNKYRIQGEVTIWVDYIEEDAESLEVAIKAAKEWAKDEYCRYLGPQEYDISVSGEEIEEDEQT